MSRALLVLATDELRAKAHRWIDGIPKYSRVEFKGPQRTLDQNASMWCKLTEISEQVIWYGQKLTPDDWKDVLTASLRRARVVPGIDPGSFVPLGMRTSDMSTAEMAELLSLIDAFGAQQGVVFTDPHDPEAPLKKPRKKRNTGQSS